MLNLFSVSSLSSSVCLREHVAMTVLTSICFYSFVFISSANQTFFFARCLFFWSHAKHYKVNLAQYWVFLHSSSRVSLWFWGGVRLNSVTVFWGLLFKLYSSGLHVLLSNVTLSEHVSCWPGYPEFFPLQLMGTKSFCSACQPWGLFRLFWPSLTYMALNKIQLTFEDPSEAPPGLSFSIILSSSCKYSLV